jgi:hypothetical protein
MEILMLHLILLIFFTLFIKLIVYKLINIYYIFIFFYSGFFLKNPNIFKLVFKLPNFFYSRYIDNYISIFNIVLESLLIFISRLYSNSILIEEKFRLFSLNAIINNISILQNSTLILYNFARQSEIISILLKILIIIYLSF